MTIVHRRFRAVWIQPSGDIVLLANTVDDVGQLTCKSDWIRTFGATTRIRKRTWGVVACGVDTNIDPKQASFKTAFTS